MDKRGQTDASRTKGCVNLGNTCYMNSAMQCIANSPYIRDFFAGVSNQTNIVQTSAAYMADLTDKENPPYKFSVNPNNLMGHKGQFVQPFAETMVKMWDSSSVFSCYPMSFKSALGKVNEQF